MILATLLLSLVYAHMHLSSPRPVFTNGPGNENAPSLLCSLIPYQPDAPHVVLASLQRGLEPFGSARAFADRCGSVCGHTRRSHLVPLPQENKVRVTVGARHVGVVEIWIDDRRVVQSDRLLDEYDVEWMCPDTCVVRFIMIAVHLFPAEIFDNCVTVVNRGQSGSGRVSVVPFRPTTVREPGKPLVQAPPVPASPTSIIPPVSVSSSVSVSSPVSVPPTQKVPSKEEPTQKVAIQKVAETTALPETQTPVQKCHTGWRCGTQQLIYQTSHQRIVFPCPGTCISESPPYCVSQGSLF
jgi:hypothetical protein